MYFAVSFVVAHVKVGNAFDELVLLLLNLQVQAGRNFELKVWGISEILSRKLSWAEFIETARNLGNSMEFILRNFRWSDHFSNWYKQEPQAFNDSFFILESSRNIFKRDVEKVKGFLDSEGTKIHPDLPIERVISFLSVLHKFTNLASLNGFDKSSLFESSVRSKVMPYVMEHKKSINPQDLILLILLQARYDPKYATMMCSAGPTVNASVCAFFYTKLVNMTTATAFFTSVTEDYTIISILLTFLTTFTEDIT